MEREKKKICLILPSLSIGGMERVMVEIADYLCKKKLLDVHLILLSNSVRFFTLNDKITVHEPGFRTKSSKILHSLEVIKFLRYKLKVIKPYSLLSFGSKYNSFVMLASLGLGIKSYLSDRSNPYRNAFLSISKDQTQRHDGILHFFLKRILYRKATGIIVQTEQAREIEEKYLKHKNIFVVPNPIRKISSLVRTNEKIILNVGRFIPLKQQGKLAEVFSRLNADGWRLIFLGDGPELLKVKNYVTKLGIKDRVTFYGNVKEVDQAYTRSEIFAFMSTSEGFPNALGEALLTPLACIAFDCTAGPSDLIINNYNGFLVPLNDFDEYQKKLQELIDSKDVREKFKENAIEHMKHFDYENIMEQIQSILTQ